MERKPDPERLTARALRLDLVIAVCALLVSTLATTASWWQTRVIAQQLSAQVWPYVSLTETAAPDRLELDLANDGLGPAVVKSFVLAVDGQPQPNFIAALHTLVGPLGPRRASGPDAQRSILFSTVSPGSVLRPSSTQPIFHVSDGAPIVARLLPQLHRVTFETCYCSILAACWTLMYPGGEPVAVRVCADRRAEQLRDLPPEAAERHSL